MLFPHKVQSFGATLCTIRMHVRNYRQIRALLALIVNILGGSVPLVHLFLKQQHLLFKFFLLPFQLQLHVFFLPLVELFLVNRDSIVKYSGEHMDLIVD